MEALAPRQAPIEDTLYPLIRHQTGLSPTVVLYDVTSSYFEGAWNERAALGYHRDTKPGTAPIVIGLMTMAEGEPSAVPVFDGNPAAPRTVPAQVETLRTRFGITEVVCVGARGMVKTQGKAALATAGAQDITALTTPQGHKLLREGVLRPAWCTPHVHEVPHGPVRLVRRRREAVRRKAPRRRTDKLGTLHALITARNAFVRPAKRAQPAAGRRALQTWVTRHQLAGGVPWSWQAGDIIVTGDEAAQTEATRFAGCDVLETDVPQTVLDAQAVHDRYRDLHEVAHDFRTRKTGLLEVRPIFVRQAPRPRAPVVVTR